jgi:predicted P-loop ATPase
MLLVTRGHPYLCKLFSAREFDVADDKIVRLPVPSQDTQDADEHARAETQRKAALFDWADAVLKRFGLDRAVAAAKSFEELWKVTLDAADNADLTLAIRDALRPASGRRQQHFDGLREGSLRQVLKSRLDVLKKAREAALRRTRQPDWTDQLKLKKDGTIIANLVNLILILREAPKWKDVLGFDEFNARVVIMKSSPPLGEAAPGTPWTDHHEALTRSWFQREDINPSAGDVGRAVQAAARHNPFHPVRDYLNALVWDGAPRLQTWLQTYLHAEDTEYIRAIGPRYLISAVARAYRPGCQADHVLVLEGPQGRLKSTLLRTLAVHDAWFADRLSNVASKDASLEVAGVWIFEISELEGLMRASPSAQKRFLTNREDRFRPPYGKYTIMVPRSCVFAGSLNPPAGGYLRDPTGARRLWPVTCIGMTDVEGVRQVRDQLWAEAAHLFRQGAAWWLETPQLEALATTEQAARYAVDAWEEPIREWLGDRTDVRLWDVLQALGLDRKQQEMQSIQKRVVAILTRLGFKQCRPRTPEGRTPRYRRDPPLKKMTDLTGDHG